MNYFFFYSLPHFRTIEVYKEKKRSTSSNECSSNESSLNQSNSNISNPTDSSTDQSINQNNSNEHNQCFIEDSDLVSLSTCDELDKNWTKLIYEEEQIKKLDSISSMSKFVKKNKRICDQESNKKSDKMIESFTNGLNVSGISRRRILANIDYSVDDGQFMCSTLIKDQEDCLKPKFQDLDECDSTKNESSINLTNHQNTLKKSNHKLELISKQMQEVETVQRHNKFFKKQNLINNKKLITSHHKTSTLNTNNSTTTADRLIYDTRKSISDLSSIEETRIDNLRNNLKNMQMNSIDKRRILKKYFNRDFNEKLDRNSIAKENFRSEMYNNENSTIINQIKKIQNYHNNQVVHDLNDQDTWFCKTKLYDDTLDEIVNKWNNLDYEIWCKIILFERNRRVAKAYIRLPYLIVTGSKIGFDGYSIGLNGFENIYRDQETEFIVKNLEKGVRIKIDEHGNLILRKMTHLSVQIKDWLQQLTEGTGSLSDDVIAMQGKLTKKKFNFNQNLINPSNFKLR